MNIHKISDFIKIFKPPTNPKLNWSFPITFLEFDIKEQYTNLNRSDVIYIQAINDIIKKFGVHYISIHKQKTSKSRDCLGQKQSKKFYTISFVQILNYVKFELATSHFLVGCTLIQQNGGLPMGALTSAALAVLFCMFRESLYISLWKNFSFNSIAFRFRDDIRFICNKHLSPDEIKALHANLQIIYGPDLLIKLENSSYKSCSFVGTFLMFISNRFVLLYSNKNFPFNENLSYVTPCQTKTRFPDLYAEWPSSTLQAVVFSSFFQALTISSEPLAFLISFSLLSIEFLTRGYRISWIYSALNKLAIPYIKSCLAILKFITDDKSFKADLPTLPPNLFAFM